jgi:hypothetical protein
MAMMEEVTGFEAGRRLVIGERTGVKEAIGGVEHPDGDEHGGGFDPGKRETGTTCDEEGPKGSDGGSVERKKVPESEGGWAPTT